MSAKLEAISSAIFPSRLTINTASGIELSRSIGLGSAPSGGLPTKWLASRRKRLIWRSLREWLAAFRITTLMIHVWLSMSVVNSIRRKEDAEEQSNFEFSLLRESATMMFACYSSYIFLIGRRVSGKGFATC